MPVIVKPIFGPPIKSEEEEDPGEGSPSKRKVERMGTKGIMGEPFACLEVINKLGIIGRSIRHKANMDPLDVEMLDLFE